MAWYCNCKPGSQLMWCVHVLVESFNYLGLKLEEQQCIPRQSTPTDYQLENIMKRITWIYELLAFTLLLLICCQLESSDVKTFPREHEHSTSFHYILRNNSIIFTKNIPIYTGLPIWRKYLSIDCHAVLNWGHWLYGWKTNILKHIIIYDLLWKMVSSNVTFVRFVTNGKKQAYLIAFKSFELVWSLIASDQMLEKILNVNVNIYGTQ